MSTAHLSARTQAFRIVFIQSTCVILMAVVALFFYGETAGISLLGGGLSYVLPTLLFVWRVFRYSGAQQMTRFLVAFMLGEAIKLVLSAILFIMIVKYFPVSLLSVLVGFVGAIISFWFACIWLFSKQTAIKIT